MTPLRWSAVSLARALGQQHDPTPEQIEVIEAPLAPLLVVAGAGAGKTETMAARVVYLVANQLVEPHQVLGLTFTRKAASQLSQRIRQRLAQLKVPFDGEPEVLTYHAFGGRLLAEFGVLVGVEPAARVLTPTSSWQLASSVVRRWDADLDTELAPDLVTERLLQLSGSLADHLRTPTELADSTAALAALIEQARPSARQTKPILSALEGLHARLTNRNGILPLVSAFAAAKKRTGVVDFGDQMQLAATLVTEHPRVGSEIRDRYRVVLLDEYQDTGHAQRVLLRSLFGVDSGRQGHAVTAVGDPCQSIYGWRGAAASNLPRFCSDFVQRRGTPARRLPLLTSFRNPVQVLGLANTLSAPVRGNGVDVDELRARADAPHGAVELGLFGTVDDEDSWVADRIAEHWQAAATAGVAPPTTAVLCRRRSSIRGLADRLSDRGIPVEIPGIAGLLTEPEVAEVLSVLRMLVDPAAGAAAVRVLGGPRWNLGLRDLAALESRARELNGRVSGPPAEAGNGRGVVHRALQAALTDEVEAASLLDALADPGPASQYSSAGFRRIRDLGAELRRLRGRLSMPLTDLLVEIERTIGLDVEAALAGRSGRANLDELAAVVADFVDGGFGRSVPVAADELTGVHGRQALDLLAFLDVAADREEGLELGEVEQRADAVQLVTVHAAKGLEWQLVAVPHLAEGVFPGVRSSTWLTDDSYLPPDLRGDALDLPQLAIPADADQKAIEVAVTAHKADWKRVQAVEERRLMYVALTRAEQTLLASGHWWSRTTTKPRGPSEFLLELVAAAAAPPVHWADPPDPGASNPLTRSAATARWPVDPLGERRAGVEEGAHLVRLVQHFGGEQALDGDHGTSSEPDLDEYEWDRDVVALLRERATARGRSMLVPLPETVSVATLVELADDPQRLAAKLRRPVPRQPSTAARRGTLFHTWLEHHYQGDALLDLDELPGADERDALPEQSFEELRRSFLDSEWAGRVPHDQEVSFSMTIGALPVRGRIDAVFADADGGWTVVDWKTGRIPERAQQAAAAVQLAVYRLAWAQLSGSPLAAVRAAFYFVASRTTIAPADLLDADQIDELIRANTQPDGPGGTGADSPTGSGDDGAGEAGAVAVAPFEM